MQIKNKIYQIFLLICMLTLSNQKCSDGCLKCKGNNICQICDALSLYVLINGDCIKQDLDYCMLSLGLNSCTKCYPGFYLEISGKCMSNPSGINAIQHCKEYSSYTRCEACDQYYYIENEGRSCKRIDSSPIKFCEVYESDTKCKVCGDFILSGDQSRCSVPLEEDKKCMFYSDKTVCLECKDTHYLDKNYYINHIEEFYTSVISKSVDYFFNQDSVLNVPVCESKHFIDKCTKPLGNYKCEECEEGYHINTNFNECIKNPETEFFFRSDDIPNCFLHNKTMIERNNEQVLNIECILCYEGFFKSVNNRKCVNHSNIANNCETMSQSIENECLICDNGYYREDDLNTGEKCKQRVDQNENCQKYHLLSQECETCIDTSYIKHYHNIFCSPKIEYCKTHNTEGKILSCQQCNFGYYFSVSQGACKKNDVFDPYCAYYNENQECKECSFGFYYDEEANPPKCYPNSPEYVEKAKCQNFHSLNKNDCIGCASSSKLITILNTCKMFPNNLYSNQPAKETMQYCNQYELNQTGLFSCKEPTPEVVENDESLNKLYILYTDQEKAFEKTSSRIQYCQKHKTIYKNSTEQIICEECYKTRFINTHFSYDNVANLDNCKEDDTDSGFCVKYFTNYNICRQYTWNNIDTNRCENRGKGCTTILGNTNCPHQQTCQYCRWKCNYDTSWTLNNCAGGGWVDEECYSKDDFGNCLVFVFFQSGMGVSFYEDIEYEIVLSPDQTQCLMYDTRYIDNNSNCVKLTDNSKSCIICKKGYYSVPTVTFTYPLDSIESYVAKQNIENFVDKCIIFNDITKICSRCAPGYFLSRNTCVTCGGSNTAIDNTGLTCIQYVDADFGNTCKRVGVDVTTSYCIECKSGYVSQIDWDKDKNIEITYFPRISNSQTMIELISETSVVKKCIDTNDLFYVQEDYQESLINCRFYQTVESITYCLGCKFGFSGTVVETLNSFLTVQNCQEDSECDLSQTYPLKKAYINSLITCHKCTDSSKIPTYHFFYQTGVDVDEPSFMYNPSHSSKKTMTCETPVISNCLIQFKTNDPLVRTKWGGTDFVCVYCEPEYHPTYSTTSDDFFPYEKITSCSSIPYCENSLIPNECEACVSSSSSPNTNDRNFVPSGGTSSCVTNDYIDEDPFCKKTSSSTASGTCDECKDGYVYLNLKCVQLNITNCKYFRSSTCVESVKELDENKSIIWREYNSDYKVEQVTCIEVESGIDNCAYYSSEDLCYKCEDEYFLATNKKSCFKQETANCIEYNYETTLCSKCESNYDITSSGICIPTIGGNARGCLEYRNGICSKCVEEGFHPVKINANKTSICINSTITRFCEEIDEEMLLNEKVLSCKNCQTYKDYSNLSTEDNFAINNFDFFSVSDETFSDSNGLTQASQIWNFYSSMNSEFTSNIASSQDLRIALFKYNFEVCKEFTEVTNCAEYDNSSFEKTFDCIKCTDNYYLQNKVCEERTLEDFCVEYYIEKNECKRFVDTWNYSIKYSSFDEYVIQNQPPSIETNISQDSGIEGCVGYLDNTTCRHCNNTTYLYDNLCLTVSTIVPECEIYSRDGLCSKCKNDLLLFQNKCLVKYATNCDKFLSNTSCEKCPINYPYMINNSCKKNPDIDYCEEYINAYNCNKCQENYFRNQNGRCVLNSSYIQNCKIHLVGPFCQECNDGYVLQDNKCQLSPFYDRNCKTYENTSTCNICQFNHYFKNGSCYECDTDSFSCYFCDPESPSTCVLCKPGFFMNNLKKCVIIPNYTQPMIKLYLESQVSKNISLISIWFLLKMYVYLFF